MTYNEALSYIHSVCWKGSVPGLSRTEELLSKMGNPHKDLKFIHIAGTNGKGSTAAMLSSILEAAGLRVGLYTSPFINRFNERMQVNHNCIEDEELAALTEYVKPFADSMEDVPTEFELITALAMEYFKRQRCDIVVLEVGMGGALDSTNVIDTPELAILCAMGFDHTAELGSTMEEIARNKAGIIKEGGTVVCYGQNEDAMKVFEEVSKEKHATLIRPDYSTLVAQDISLHGQVFSFGDMKDITIPLVGTYQLYNAAVVITAAKALAEKGYPITEEIIRAGLKGSSWPARFEILHQDPVFIVDGGHNPHGIKATAASLTRIFPEKKFIFITGVMADKDVEHILGHLVPMAQRFYTVTPDNPRAMKADVLANRIAALGVEAIPCTSVRSGVEAAMAYAGTEGVVCAVGSLYMSGEVRACFQKDA